MLKQKFLIDFGAKFGSYLLTALTGIIVARVAGPKVVGVIAYATAYVSTFGFITGLFGSAHIKFVSEGQDERTCLANYRRLLTFSTILFIIVVVGLFVTQKYVLKYKFDSSETEIVLLITLAASAIGMIYQFNETVHTARTEQYRSNLPGFFRSILYNGLRIAVVFMGMGAIALAGVNLISIILILPLTVYFIKRLDFGVYSHKLTKKYISISLPMFIIVITGSLMAYTDKIILEYYGSSEEIGYYSAASSIGGMLILLGNTAGTVFFPLFSSLFAKGELNTIRNKIKKFEDFIFLFVFPMITALSLFSYPIVIFLLGHQYESSVPMFSVLVFSSFFIIWGMPYGNMLSGLGLFWLAAGINVVKFLIFATSLFLLISPGFFNLGGMALAYTALIINVFSLVAYYFFSWKKTKIHFRNRQITFLLFWLVLYFVFFKYIIPELQGINIYQQLFLFIPGFLIIVYVLYLLLGIFRFSDFRILKQIIDPKENIRYIKNEIKK